MSISNFQESTLCVVGPHTRNTPSEANYCNDAEAAIKLSPPPDYYWIHAQDMGFANKQLQLLRAHSRHFYKPIFLYGAINKCDNPMSDGCVDSISESQSFLNDYQERLLALGNTPPPLATLDRILFFLYLRPKTKLTPSKAYNHPTLHYYPWVDALLASQDEGLGVIDTLRNQDFLHSSAICGKQHECPRCQRPHLQFIDQCPRCASFRIDQKPFLHCFNCGRVAPQDEFLSDKGMLCPQCGSKLSQVGVDYDRPMEQGHCTDCGFLFSEPDVQAHCLHCGNSCAPDDLSIRMIHDLTLGPQGHVAIRAGGIDSMFKEQEQANLVTFASFRHTLAWSLRLAWRYREIPFALVSFSLQDLPALEKAHGFHDSTRICENLFERIQGLFRNTDLMTRRNNSSALILLPQTPTEGCAAVQNRIADLISGIEKRDSIILPYKINELPLPSSLDERITVEALIDKIEKGN